MSVTATDDEPSPRAEALARTEAIALLQRRAEAMAVRVKLDRQRSAECRDCHRSGWVTVEGRRQRCPRCRGTGAE